MMSLLSALLIVFSASAPAPSGGTDSCFHYAPGVVVLTGRLMQRTLPGPPHYDSFRRGDRPEVVDFLVLDTPLCTVADYKGSPNTDAFTGQDTVQVRKHEANGARRSAAHRTTRDDHRHVGRVGSRRGQDTRGSRSDRRSRGCFGIEAVRMWQLLPPRTHA